MGQEKKQQHTNAHISTVNIAALSLLSDTTSLSSSSVYSASSIHPSSESLVLSLQSSSRKSIYPMLQETKISLTSHRIFADLNVETTQ